MKSNLFERFSIFAFLGAVARITPGGFVMLPQQANAEDASEGIEEVLVTARRREETAQSVPIPISALSSE